MTRRRSKPLRTRVLATIEVELDVEVGRARFGPEGRIVEALAAELRERLAHSELVVDVAAVDDVRSMERW